jgi:dienelactone hydrolase
LISEIYVYDAARHGFMKKTKDGYNEGAAILAWKRMVAFFKEKLINLSQVRALYINRTRKHT